MPDELDKLSPADPRDLAAVLAFALRFQGRKRVHSADEIMSEIVAKRGTATNRRSFHDNEARALQMLDEALRHPRRPPGRKGRRRSIAFPAPSALESSPERISLQMHKRAAALDLHVVGKVAQPDKVMTFARVENDPDNDAAPIGGVERVENDWVCESVRREVD